MKSVRKGIFGKLIQIFDLEELEKLSFTPKGIGGGTLYIDVDGRMHLEWGHIAIFPGRLFQFLFSPKKYYQNFGRELSKLSLHKEAGQLLGGLQFMILPKSSELVVLTVGLIPKDQLSQEQQIIRKIAFNQLMAGVDRVAETIKLTHGITATDNIPPDHLAQFGWNRYQHSSFFASIRHRLIWFPVPVRHFYSKRWILRK